MENKSYVPIKKIEDRLVPKEPSKYDGENDRKLSLNAKAMNILYCAIDSNEFNRITSCTFV